MIGSAGHELADRAIVKDDVAEIRAKVQGWIADPGIDVVITTGGTGFTGRDVTPEAVQAAVREGDRRLLHRLPHDLIRRRWAPRPSSRAPAPAWPQGTYIFCLPGSPGACKDAWNDILKWQLDNRHRPCNFVEIMPRLEEHRRKG